QSPSAFANGCARKSARSRLAGGITVCGTLAVVILAAKASVAEEDQLKPPPALVSLPSDVQAGWFVTAELMDRRGCWTTWYSVVGRGDGVWHVEHLPWTLEPEQAQVYGLVVEAETGKVTAAVLGRE